LGREAFRATRFFTRFLVFALARDCFRLAMDQKLGQDW
jgi:hypothetical protein